MAAALLIGGVVYGGATSGPQRYMVHAGDTLWGIVQSHYGADDVHSRVSELEAVNHLSSGGLTPGRILILPAP